MHDKNNDQKHPVPLMTRFFRGCLLLLAGIIVLGVAVKILAQFWGWLLLLVAIAALIYAAAWYVRWRRDRRW